MKMKADVGTINLEDPMTKKDERRRKGQRGRGWHPIKSALLLQRQQKQPKTKGQEFANLVLIVFRCANSSTNFQRQNCFLRLFQLLKRRRKELPAFSQPDLRVLSNPCFSLRGSTKITLRGSTKITLLTRFVIHPEEHIHINK